MDYSIEDTDKYNLQGPGVVPSDDVVTQRAAKADYALGKDSPGADTIKESIKSGDEDTIRQSAAAGETWELQRQKIAMVRDFAEKSGGSVTPEQAGVLMDMSAVDLATNPKEVFEKKFAERYGADALAVNGDNSQSVPQKAIAQAPDDTTNEYDVFTKSTAQNQYFQTRMENLEAKIQSQSYVGYAADLASGFVPLLQAYRLHDVVKKTPVTDLLPGDNMLEQVKALYLLPIEEGKKRFDTIMDKLEGTNLQTAKEFNQAVLSYGTTEARMSDVFGVADAATLATPFLGLGKSLLKTTAKDASDMAVNEMRHAVGTAGIPTAISPEDIERLKIDTAKIVGQDRANRTVRNPRPMSIKELDDVRTGLGLPQESRMFTPEEITRLQANVRGITPPTGASVAVPRFLDMNDIKALQERTLGRFLSKDELDEMGSRLAAGQALREMKVALKTSAKAAGTPQVDAQALLTQAGDVRSAGMIGATKSISMLESGEDVGALLSKLQPAFNPKNWWGGEAQLSEGFTQNIIDKMTSGTDAILNTIGRLNVPRLTKEAQVAGVRETQKALATAYQGRMNDSVVAYLHVPPELNPNKLNVDTVIMRVGKPNALPFESRVEAENWRKNIYQLPEGHVEQIGSGFYIHVPKFVDETTDVVRAAQVTTDNTTQGGMFRMLTNRLLGADQLLSKVQRENRQIAATAPQVLNRELREQIDMTAKNLSRDQAKAVERVLERNRDEINQATGQRGIFYTSKADFDQAFMKSEGRLPTAAEAAHYYNYTRISDIEYLTRNLALYRDKARLGFEQFSWKEAGEQMPSIEGKKLDGIPWHKTENAGIWFVDSNSPNGGELLYKFNLTGGKATSGAGLDMKAMDKLVKEHGYEVWQIANPKALPLKGKIPTDEQIHFIVTNKVERKPLSWLQVEYRPGGHSIYPDPWWIKQPVIMKGAGGRDYYHGDNAAMNFTTRSQAEHFTEHFNKAREMYHDQAPGLDSYLAQHLPYTREQFEKLFTSGHLRPDVPVVPTFSGNTTFESATWLKDKYRDVIDSTKSQYNLEGLIDRSYLADRDNVIGTVDDKTFRVVPARQLDPYTALNRSLGQAVRNLWLNDYKVGAVESWLAEFGELMKPEFKTLNQSPLYFLHNPQFKENIENQSMLAAAKASQRAIVNFIGARSELGNQVQHIQNALADSIFNKGGTKAAQVFNDSIIPAIKEPDRYLRAVGFHSKLGLYNPIQLWKQANSLSNVIGIAGPTVGAQGFAAYMLMRYAAHTSEQAILDRVAKISTKFGWKESEFKEMHQAMRASGRYEVGGETALRDDGFDPKLYRSGLGHWLDKSAVFFNEGERIPRLTAFASAYKEWRNANKAADLTDRAMGQIMQRADAMAVHMTRASSASWQSGLASVPTQFLSYPARVAEQFFGKELTGAEKVRLFTTYSALYGVPAAAGAVTGVIPFYDDIREEALKRGIDMSPAYIKAMSDGIISMGIELATGVKTDFAKSFSPGGTTYFRDVINGEKKILDVVGGASGSILGSIIESTDPLRRAVANATMADDNEKFPTKAKDWLRVLQETSTGNLGVKVWGLMNYGELVSKNGVRLNDPNTNPMGTMEAVLSTMGLTPQSVSDTYMKLQSMKEQRAAQKYYEDKAAGEFAKAIQAGADGDKEGFTDYMTRYASYIKLGKFNFEDRDRIFQRVSKYRPDLQSKVNWDFVRTAPEDQYAARFSSFFKR